MNESETPAKCPACKSSIERVRDYWLCRKCGQGWTDHYLDGWWRAHKDARRLERRNKRLTKALKEIVKRTLCFKSGEIAENALAELKEEKP